MKCIKYVFIENTVSLFPYRVGFGQKRGNSGVYIDDDFLLYRIQCVE